MTLNLILAILPTPFFLGQAHFCESGKIIPVPNSFSNLSFLPFFFLFIFCFDKRIRDREREGALQPSSQAGPFASRPSRPAALTLARTAALSPSRRHLSFPRSLPPAPAPLARSPRPPDPIAPLLDLLLPLLCASTSPFLLPRVAIASLRRSPPAARAPRLSAAPPWMPPWTPSSSASPLPRPCFASAPSPDCCPPSRPSILPSPCAAPRRHGGPSFGWEQPQLRGAPPPNGRASMAMSPPPPA